MRHSPLVLVVLAGASALALACTHARSATGSAAKEDRVIVTGSHVPQPASRNRSCLPATTSRVVAYPAEALLQTGTPGDLAASLSRANPAIPCRPTNASPGEPGASGEK